jgi:hypothetical protein
VSRKKLIEFAKPKVPMVPQEIPAPALAENASVSQ